MLCHSGVTAFKGCTERAVDAWNFSARYPNLEIVLYLVVWPRTGKNTSSQTHTVTARLASAEERRSIIALDLQGVVRFRSIASMHLLGIKCPGNVPVEGLVHRLGCFGGMPRRA